LKGRKPLNGHAKEPRQKAGEFTGRKERKLSLPWLKKKRTQGEKGPEVKRGISSKSRGFTRGADNSFSFIIGKIKKGNLGQNVIKMLRKKKDHRH